MNKSAIVVARKKNPTQAPARAARSSLPGHDSSAIATSHAAGAVMFSDYRYPFLYSSTTYDRGTILALRRDVLLRGFRSVSSAVTVSSQNCASATHVFGRSPRRTSEYTHAAHSSFFSHKHKARCFAARGVQVTAYLQHNPFGVTAAAVRPRQHDVESRAVHAVTAVLHPTRAHSPDLDTLHSQLARVQHECFYSVLLLVRNTPRNTYSKNTKGQKEDFLDIAFW